MGTIIKKWSGFFREAFTDADNFQLQCTRGSLCVCVCVCVCL
jgi:hypothetical protein